MAQLGDLREELGLPVLPYDEVLSEIGRQAATAERRFTIAFVGTFNSGKSTIINSLLQLDGDRRLSDEDSPDTARSIRLTARESDDQAEAVLYFRDGTSEETSWSQARRLTSQVTLDERPDLRGKSENLVEVEYRLEHPLLATCDLLDLPGTGTRNWHTDSALTHRKLKEAELVFWVIATCAPEPADNDLHDLRVLHEFRSQVVPLINVWSLESEGISGMVTPEDMAESIRNNLGRFFSEKSPCLTLWAKEIDEAQLVGEPLDEEWGHRELRDFLQAYLQDDQKKRRDKIQRISGAIRGLLVRFEEHRLTDQVALEEVVNQLFEDRNDLVEREGERVDIGHELRLELREISGEKAHRLVEHVAQASRTFVDQELRLTNFRPLFDKLRRRGVEKQLAERFRTRYLHLDKEPNWLDELVREHLEDSRTLVEARWKRFLLDLGRSLPKGKKPPIPSDFLTNTLSTILFGQIAKSLTWLLIGALGALLFVPGGIVVEIVSLTAVFVVHGLSDPLEKRRESAKLQAQVAIEANVFAIKNQLADLAMSLHDELDKKFGEELEKQQDALSTLEATLHDARTLLDELADRITVFKHDMVAFESAGL